MPLNKETKRNQTETWNHKTVSKQMINVLKFLSFYIAWKNL